MKWVLLIIVLDNGSVWEKFYLNEAACLQDQAKVTKELTDVGTSFISKCEKVENVDKVSF